MIKIDDFVTITPIISSRSLEGLQGKIVGITGSIQPFHYLIALVGHDGNTVLVRGDEIKVIS